jgi:hypothetical protein
VHDRTDLTPAELEALKDDLIQTISRHIEIDPDAVQIGLEKDGRSQRLVADIPKNATCRRVIIPCMVRTSCVVLRDGSIVVLHLLYWHNL